MPRVAGVYSLPPSYEAVSGQTIRVEQHNPPLEDIAAVLNEATPITAGGTGATTAAGALTALGAQEQDANLDSLAGLTLAADKGLYSTGASTLALFDLTAAGRALLDDADASAQRTTLGLGTASLMYDSADADLSNDPDAAARRDIVAAAIAASGTVYGTSVASTSGTAVLFTGIPSGARKVTLHLNGVSTNGASTLIAQIGDSGGIEASGYSSNAGHRSSDNDVSTGYALTVGFDPAMRVYGNVDFYNDDGNRWITSGGLGVTSSIPVTFGGSKTLSGTLTQIQLTTSGGSNTFDAGTVGISWEV